MNISFLFSQTGGVGIKDMIEKIEHKDYMGFENLCTYDA